MKRVILTAVILASASVANAAGYVRTYTGRPAQFQQNQSSFAAKPDWYQPMLQKYMGDNYGINSYTDRNGRIGSVYSGGSSGGGSIPSYPVHTGPKTYINPFVKNNPYAK